MLSAGPAQAAGACRSDPVVVVNGMAADIVSTLWTASPSTIKELDYTITVPTGSLLGTTTLTVGAGFPEKVVYVFSAQQPHGTLRVAASVVTTAGMTPFQTDVQVTTLGGITTASGLSNTIISLTSSSLLSL